MKKVVLTVLFSIVFSSSLASAGIVWESDFNAFRYAVETNGGMFYFPSLNYFKPDSQSTAVQYYQPSQGLDADYDAVASGN